MPTLTPAYGRNYRYSTDVIAAYEKGVDFLLNDITSPWNGRACSSRDFVGVEVELRYNHNRDFVFHTYKG